MIYKSIFMLALFFIPLVLLITLQVQSTALLFLLFILSGFGMAGIGMGIMHDALHGSYSKHKSLNKIMGYSINLIGANASIWKIQHNVLHHTYTNVDEADDDIAVPGVLRFSPNGKHHWFHKFQHLYVWPFYCLVTVIWSTAKDFTKLARYRKMGFFQDKRELRFEILKSICWKALFFTYTLVLPIIFVPQATWIIILAHLSMQFVTGLCLSIIFQIAHVMPSSEFPLPDKNGNMELYWSAHQLNTTTNFSPNCKWFSWLIGGLNFQIEHHLLPNVSHVHYRALSKIVKQTAEEHGLPYNSRKNFFTALRDHVYMLKLLGNPQAAKS